MKDEEPGEEAYAIGFLLFIRFRWASETWISTVFGDLNSEMAMSEWVWGVEVAREHGMRSVTSKERISGLLPSATVSTPRWGRPTQV